MCMCMAGKSRLRILSVTGRTGDIGQSHHLVSMAVICRTAGRSIAAASLEESLVEGFTAAADHIPVTGRSRVEHRYHTSGYRCIIIRSGQYYGYVRRIVVNCIRTCYCGVSMCIGGILGRTSCFQTSRAGRNISNDGYGMGMVWIATRAVCDCVSPDKITVLFTVLRPSGRKGIIEDRDSSCRYNCRHADV